MNRRRRQRLARQSAATPTPVPDRNSSAADTPLSKNPPSNPSEAKRMTLYEIAAERQAELAHNGQPFPKTANQTDSSESSIAAKFVTLFPSADISTTTPTDALFSDTPATDLPNAILDTLLLSIPLSTLHFTLSFLTAHQYAQQDLVSIQALLKQTALVACPTLTLLIHIFHGHAIPFTLTTKSSPSTRAATRLALQVFYVIVANVAGCYLIYLTNDKGYYAVMKRAPAIGTLWVWCIIELGLLGALAGVLGPWIFAWWNGYGVL